MKSRSAFLLCLVLLLVTLLPHVPSSHAASIPDIGLGFGPSSVQPISQGVPLYTQGDNLWLESYYNNTIVVQLENPDQTGGTGAIPVEPGQLFLLYTFLGHDPSGTWSLTVSSAAGISIVEVVLSSPNSSLALTYGGVHLNGSHLNQTFNLPATDAYNIQVCSMGQFLSHGVSFGLAGGLNGTVVVSLSGNSTLFTVSGTASSLSVWLELYSQYSYILSGGVTASRNLLVASTPVLTATPPLTSQNLSLEQQAPLRQGRFDARIFVRTSAGLALYDSQFLRTSDGTWISLESCTSMVNVYSEQVFLATNLDSANSSWPRQIYTMYTLNGQESYSQTPVPGSEAAIHLKDFPDRSPLAGVTISASAPGLSPSDWDSINSSVYMLTTGVAGAVSLTLSFEGVIVKNLSVSLAGPYSSKSLSVAAGTLVASTTLHGNLVGNSTISVSASGSAPVVIKQSASGTISLLLPPDNYTLAATYSGSSASRIIPVTAGHISTVSLELGQPSVPTTLYLLVALGIGGIVANVLVWRQYLERRKVYGG